MSASDQEIDQSEDATEKSVPSETEESIQLEEAEAAETKLEHEPISEEQETETPASKPKRGGNRRSRKRRGGPRKVASTTTEAKQAVSSEEIQPSDDTEIEVTGHKKEDASCEKSMEEPEEEEEEEEEEVRDPSPVVTRRSNRKLQQQIKEDNADEQESMEVDNEREEEEAESQQELLDLDQDEVESVASELESIASSSTLTTRSRRTKGSQDSVRPRRRGKVVKKNGINSTSVKGKSRRAIFKKSATRAPSAVAKAVTSERVYYRGLYWTKGDIVSVEDMDGSVYYAQLRGFLTDQYCEKSGVITWLLPTTNSPKAEEGFDASTYVIGPEEDLPRKLEYFTFVMHAPDDYFYYKRAPYPTVTIQSDKEYLVTRQGPRVRSIKAGKTVYQDLVPSMIPIPSMS